MATAVDHRRRPRAPWARSGGPPSAGEQLDAWLLRCVDAGLAAVIFLVPLILGGRGPGGQLVLVALTLWLAVCWCLRQSLVPEAAWRRSAVEFLLLAACALAALQLVALPASLLGALSPQTYEILPLWAPGRDAPAGLGLWTTLSLTPAATRGTLVLLLAFGLLFLVTVQRVREVADAERIIRWIGISALLMAIFALVQYLSSNGKFFWFYEHPFSDTNRVVKGSYANRNHFAHFVALGIGPLIWWVQDALRGGSRPSSAWGAASRWGWQSRDVQMGLRVLALGLAVFAALMSLSRGGAMAMFVAFAVSMLILYRGGRVGRRTLLVVAGIGLFVMACLQIYGYDSVAGRIDDFRSIDELDGLQVRRMLWKADLGAVADYPLTGSGLGSHAEVCPIYLPNTSSSQRTDFTHAENGYLQVALEGGLPGLLLALTAIGLCTYWCVWLLARRPPTRVLLCVAAVGGSLAASFVHALVDFVWYIPGCMVVVVMLAACGNRLWQEERERRGKPGSVWRVPRSGWLAATACLALLGYFMLQDRLAVARAEEFWNRYQLRARTLPDGDDPIPREMLQAMVEDLAAVVSWQPDHARARAQLAALHMKLFESAEDPAITPLSVKQVREAARASGFPSVEQLRGWLNRAFGPRCRHLDEALRHARRAVALCPLQGEAYLYLADLSFLEGSSSPGKAAYVRQALRVRPYDGAVLFAAGQEAMLLGDRQRTIEYWRASFHAGALHQRRLLQLLAPQVPAEFFLDGMQPDLPALRQIRKHYRDLGRPDDLRLVLQRLSAAAEHEARGLEGTPAARRWLEAGRAYAEMDALGESCRCARSAVDCDASCYSARHALGRCLYKMGEYARAEKQLTWCLQRRPADEKVRALLEASIDRRLRMSSPRTAERAPPTRLGGLR